MKKSYQCRHCNAKPFPTGQKLGQHVITEHNEYVRSQAVLGYARARKEREWKAREQAGQVATLQIGGLTVTVKIEKTAR